MVPDPASKALVRTLLLTGSLWIFALFIQTDFPLKGLAVLGLILSAYRVSVLLRLHPEAYLGISLWRWRPQLWLVTFIAMAAALLLSIYYRLAVHMPWMPAGVGPFVFISVLIGCCEEIIFRGFVQGEANLWSKEGAIVLASVSHAGYKSLLFVLATQPIDITLANLFIVTFLAGLGLGFVRYRSGSLWPPIIAHGFFDLWVYMELSSAPWWVW